MKMQIIHDSTFIFLLQKQINFFVLKSTFEAFNLQNNHGVKKLKT